MSTHKFETRKLFEQHVLELAHKEGPDKIEITPSKSCNLSIKAKRGRETLFEIKKIPAGTNETVVLEGVHLELSYLR